MSRRKICVVTGSRADYGLVFWLMKDITSDRDCRLQVVATGMHLSPEFGLTYKIIEADGFTINARVEMLLSSDTPVGVAKSIGLGVIGFGEVFDRLKPDLVVLPGDRFEIFSAAQAALVAKIPIAHIAGGDITEGAFDEALRHGITKMSHLHFVTNEAAARRVRQLGENPQHIHNFGSPGIDYIKRLDLLARDQLEKELDLRFSGCNILVTFHPATLDARAPELQLRALLAALGKLTPKRYLLIFTRPNADAGGRVLITMIDQFVANHANARVYTSLGQRLYLSLLNEVDAIVGNSSSGLYEAPSFGIPTVNIGDRQKGRLQAASVINCRAVEKEIAAALRKALAKDCTSTKNPYGTGDSARRILAALKRVRDPAAMLKKHFFDFAK